MHVVPGVPHGFSFASLLVAKCLSGVSSLNQARCSI